MTALEQLGILVATSAPDERTSAALRLHVADTIGAWIAATSTEEGKALLALRKEDDALSDRVAVNVALTRLSEIDDIHLAAMITPGAIVVPAALTMAASLPNPDAGDLAAAIVAGYEAMIRLGAAIDGPSVLYRGIWPTYFAAPFGVAAAASRLLKLDATKTANALSAALIMAAPGTGHHAAVTTIRWLAVGQAAARGLHAARAAEAGFTSDLRIAEGDLLKNIYGLMPDASILARGFGEPALSQTSFKPWCAARQTMGATQALKEILAAGVSVESIQRIGAAVLPPHLKMIDHGVTPGDRFSHLTSVQYQMALAALSPGDAYSLGGRAGPLPPELSGFMARIQVRADKSLLNAGYPQAWAAHVTVTTREGRRQHPVTSVPGDPARPFTEDDIREKFIRVVAPVMVETKAERMFADALAALGNPAAMLKAINNIG